MTGTLTYTVTSVLPAGNVLTLATYQNGLTGTSNGTTTTTGTLSNGVARGNLDLNRRPGDPSCAVSQGTFVMCQGSNTCIAP